MPPSEPRKNGKKDHSLSQPEPPSRLLFVEVRGLRNKRQSGLRYDKSASQLKSHVMLHTSKNKLRLRQTSERPTLAVELATRLCPEPSPHQTDPFQTMPVEETPEMHAAIRYYFEHYYGPTPLTDDSRICNKNRYERESAQWSRVQFSFCRNHKLTYYMMLFSWQAMRNTFTDAKYEICQAWGKVLQATREEMPLSRTGPLVSEPYVVSVAGLGVIEIWLGNFPDSKRHRDGMLSLIAARGGFSTFCQIAQRALKWCEFHPCACLTMRPELPRLPVQPLPPGLAKTMEAAHRRTMALLPPQLAQSELNTIFYQLHIATFAHSSSPHPSFASVMDDLEHRILLDLVERKERAAAAPLADPMDMVYSTLLQAAQMCVFGVIPSTRKEMPMYRLFVEQLRDVLVVGTWGAAASDESLLWVLFIGWSTASQLRGDTAGAVENAKYFIRQFSSVLEVLGVRDEASLHRVMREFPWAECYREPLNVLWNVCSNDTQYLY